MRFLYTLLWYALLPALLLRLWWRGRKAPAYRSRWGERLGYSYRKDQKLPASVWLHAVSVGETLAAVPLIEALLKKYPDMPLVVTTTTPTGSERVQQIFGKRVQHVYCPWELPGALERFYKVFNPQLLLVMETELWPNMVALADQKKVPVVLVNGRLSEKSYRGYKQAGRLVRNMLSRFNRLLVQTDVEARRFIGLGASIKNVVVTGSIKFDLAINAVLRAQAETLRHSFGHRPVWIAASTHPGEDEQVLAAHRKLLADFPDLLLMLVPRHPERFSDVAQLARAKQFSVVRRSEKQPVTEQVQVYLCDSMGELLMFYGAADVAFVGGSLVPVGGHNLLEPAAWGMPVLSGDALDNFTHIAELLEQAGGLQLVDQHNLPERLEYLFRDAAARKIAGQAAYAVVDAHRGALGRVLAEIDALWPKG